MKTQFTPKEVDDWYDEFARKQEATDRAEYELTSAITRAIEELGLEWTCDLIEEMTRRKVDRDG